MDVAKHLRRTAAALLLAVAVPLSASAQGLIRDAEIEAILRHYSDPIFEAAGLKPSDVDLFIIQDPTMNAFVSGGQNLHVTTGLIMATETPEQLKGVIAHETGHIAGGHNVTRPQAMGAAQATSLISIGLGVLAIAAGAPDAGMALIGSSQQFAMLTFFSYTRDEESAADQYGVTFMDKTGQSADGLVSFLEKFRYEELMSSAKRDPYFRSHPISSDRISAIRARAAEVTARSHPQSQEDIDDLAMMKAKLIGFIGPPSRVANKYPPTDMSEPARYARAIAAYRAVDIKRGLTETKLLIDDHPDNPYYNELYGQILFESGKADESIQWHRRSVELAPNQPLLKVNLARSLIESEDAEHREANLKEAENLLIDAIAMEKDNAFAWNQMSNVYAKQGRKGDADLAVAEEAYILGNMPRAGIFASRAVKVLDPGTPNGQRARDITNLADPRVRGSRSRPG
jgi:predicted Zn-dependent protease